MRSSRIAIFDYNPKASRRPCAGVEQPRLSYKCIFCVWPATMTGRSGRTQKRSVRHYTADTWKPFLTMLVQKYRYRSIYFDDDTFISATSMSSACARVRKNRRALVGDVRADTSRWSVARDEGERLLGRRSASKAAIRASWTTSSTSDSTSTMPAVSSPSSSASA